VEIEIEDRPSPCAFVPRSPALERGLRGNVRRRKAGRWIRVERKPVPWRGRLGRRIEVKVPIRGLLRSVFRELVRCWRDTRRMESTREKVQLRGKQSWQRDEGAAGDWLPLSGRFHWCAHLHIWSAGNHLAHGFSDSVPRKVGRKRFSGEERGSFLATGDGFLCVGPGVRTQEH